MSLFLLSATLHEGFTAPLVQPPLPSLSATRASAPPLAFLESLNTPQVAVLDIPGTEQRNQRQPLDGIDGSSGSSDNDALWPWQLALMGITACWGANFAVTTYALGALGGDAQTGSLFLSGRFVVAAVLLLPFLATASSASAVRAGAQVGGLCAFGYATQAMALGMGTSSGTAAFICSLQSVVVALMAARASGVAPRTWLAVGLSVAGVGCLELPSVLGAAADGAAAAGPCLGDLVAFGQPLGFGLSYVLLEKTMDAHPEDELPLAALQCAVIASAAVGAASIGGHATPWELPWGSLLPDAASAAAHPSAPWGVPAAIAYTGVVSTALTIWLTAKVFKRLPSTDASIILASEPLWATGFAALLLGEQLSVSSGVGGALILGALACNEGACDGLLRPAEPARDE